jgi:hypothetical protein
MDTKKNDFRIEVRSRFTFDRQLAAGERLAARPIFDPVTLQPSRSYTGVPGQ